MPVDPAVILRLKQRVMTGERALHCCGKGKSNASLAVELMADLFQQAQDLQGKELLAFVEPLPAILRVPTVGISGVQVLQVFGLLPFSGGINFQDLLGETPLPGSKAQMEAIRGFAGVVAGTIRKTAVEDCLECVSKFLLSDSNPQKTVYEVKERKRQRI